MKNLEKTLKKIGNQKIVLVGGCFDIVHLGHLRFLEKAKNKGEILMILLESDQNIKKSKGPQRPINNQKNRATFLTKLKMVDHIIRLPEMKSDQDYFELITKIKPAIIAISQGDQNTAKKLNQAKKIGAQLIEVTKLVKHQSTSKIVEVISKIF